MSEKQIINCNIGTCEYNDCKTRKCTLKQINISDVTDIKAHIPEESMCCSYKYCE